jgi:heptosyltransferase III
MSPASRKPGILVLRGGAIGDFILTIHVLTALRGRFPHCRLELLGYPHIAQLAAELVDRIHPIEARAMTGFFVPDGELNPQLAELFGGFAIILSYLYDPEGIFQRNVARCTSGQFIAGPHRPDESLGVHATEILLQPLKQLAIYDANPTPEIRVQNPEAFPPAGGSSHRNRRVLAVHPGSGGERKNWPESSWIELLKRLLAETDLYFLLVGGEAEGDRLERLAALMPADRLELARSWPLRCLAWRLQCCSGFVGHDSGISHLAAAVGLPGLILWGPTNETVWRPRSDRMLLLREPQSLASLPVNRVMQSLSGCLRITVR